MIVGVLVACEGFKQAMGSHSSVVAKAGSQELTVERLSALLGQAKVPVTADIAKAITNIWVDYELLGVAAAHNDSLTDTKMVDDALWPIIAQMRAGKWHDVVAKAFHVDTSGGEAKFNAGEVLAARHILFLVPQGATPAQTDSIRKNAEAIRAQVTPANFTAMATKYTQEPGGAQRGGDLGVFQKGAMVPQFEQAVVALKPGQVSPLVKTQFGYHIIRRSTYAEVAPQVAQRLNGPAIQAADSVYITELEKNGNIQFKPTAVATIKEAAKDLDAHRSDKTVIATSKAGDFTVSRLTRWLEAFQQREDLGKRLQSAPDSVVLSFARNVLRNELVLHQADSAKIDLTADEYKELHARFTEVLASSWDQLGLSPKSLSDSAKTVAAREKLASTRVNAISTSSCSSRPGFVQVPPPLEQLLKEKYNVTINGAAMDKAVTSSVAMKAKNDSARAKNAPPTEVPMGGMQMPQGAPAPGATPAPAPAPAAGDRRSRTIDRTTGRVEGTVSMRHSLMFAVAAVAAAALAAPLHAQLGTADDKGGAPPVDGIVAVVGTTPILRSDVEERLAQARAAGQPMPQDSAAQQAMLRSILDAIIDEELLVQKAKDEKIEVTDNDINADVDKRMQTIRSRFTTEKEFRDELKKSGFGTVDEFRRWLVDQSRRSQMQQKLFEKLRTDGKIAPAAVSAAEVDEFFNKNSASLQKLPATVTLRQIVIAPKPSPKQDSLAVQKAESLYVEITKGGDFEQIAKRESMDPSTKELGGDLGWRRRGDFVPEFDRVFFSIRPGVVSPPIKTVFGYHLIKVDRVQPAEVKGRHILIRPAIDSS